MIEIIREEGTDGTTEGRGLPKDIRQIGKPDIGERIYVEDGAYQILHPYSVSEEKRAYVLLGRFENYAGRECTFVEAAIRLGELAFEGDLPQWNDQTWAYIYKQLRHEYDSMVIVGWAMDIRGQLPNMTLRLENLHQHNFGGARQVLFLMDSLECEEAFYGSRGSHLYRREGFYIYYEKGRAVKRAEPCAGEVHDFARQREAAGNDERFQREHTGNDAQFQREHTGNDERFQREYTGNDAQFFMEETWKSGEAEAEEECVDFSGMREMIGSGSYRKRINEQEERAPQASYATTLLLAVVVCALGVTAYLNNEKMAAMEETLAQLNGGKAVVAEMGKTESGQSEGQKVTVENVEGNVQKQETVETGGMDAAGGMSDQTAGTDAMGAAGAADGGTTGNASETPLTDASAIAQMPEGAAPADSTAEVTAPPSEEQTYLQQGYYVVQKGDSLVGICRKIYQTTAIMDKLCEVNRIEDQDSIYAGQYLTLPN